ncbi:hypothetical protein [Pengzhenrongella phosphoraccumulans]|uniref:hypothetical protein n=1 Tax=Pengzhenrongella phosphoraccumulans TaxID=3114394 RepID=UPI00388F868D
MAELRAVAEVRAASFDLVAEQPVPTDRVLLADAVAAAALAVPGVVALHTGTFGEVATYLAGRRVDGVQLRADSCSVHLVLAWGAPVLATADRVRAVVGPLVGTPVDVSVEDVVGPVGLGTGHHAGTPGTP